MRSCVLCLFVAFLPAAVPAQDAIRIEEVGLQGFYSASLPTPVRIHVLPLAQTQTIQLEFTRQTEWLESRATELGFNGLMDSTRGYASEI